MESKYVWIPINRNSDTRTATEIVSLDEFKDSVSTHRAKVKELMHRLSWACEDAGLYHDITKVTRINEYYDDFVRAMKDKYEPDGFKFEDGDWYRMHISAERHHLDKDCPPDVNLIDVLEMIADRVEAGLSRSGHVHPIVLTNDVLQLAVLNTVDLLVKDCTVFDPDESEKEDI